LIHNTYRHYVDTAPNQSKSLRRGTSHFRLATLD
jgi:hypothetical protein